MEYITLKKGREEIYKATYIAEYILSFYKEKYGCTISNLKLQKVLYFLQANHLVTLEKALFSDQILAVDFGPYISEVWEKYCIYGGANIPVFKGKSTTSFRIKKEEKEIINEMLNVLNPYSSAELLNIIHQQMPWYKAYHQLNGFNRKKIICNDDLYEFFKD